MTDEDLKAIEVRAALGITYVTVSPNSYWPDGSAEAADADRDALLAEVRRLRGLIARVDDRNEGLYAYGITMCPWCTWMGDFSMSEHSPDCPAFTESGDVR